MSLRYIFTSTYLTAIKWIISVMYHLCTKKYVISSPLKPNLFKIRISYTLYFLIHIHVLYVCMYCDHEKRIDLEIFMDGHIFTTP